jgi:hypothetical protein
MDDQEFKRILEEGESALNKARELLKNDPRKPPAWEDITPPELKPAVEHIRKEFDRDEWQLAMQVECGCYLALHPELANQPKFKGLDNLISAQKRAAWQTLYKHIKESERFKLWADQFSEVLSEIIEKPFNAFLKIALAQERLLDLPPVEWAKSLTSNLIYALKWTVPHLIKKMCDEQDSGLEIIQEHFEAYCGWVYWRAPRLIHMQPSGNTLYDPTTAWQRENAAMTERLLRGLADRMLDPATFKLDRLAGEAHVSLACGAPLPIAKNDKTPRNDTVVRMERAAPRKHVFLSYCRDNAAEVARLRQDLIAAGEAVWWDQDIKPGQDWKFAIRSAIKNAYAVVLCLSAESGARITAGIYPEVADAITAYREYAPGSIFLIPTRLSDCEIPQIDGTRTLDRLQYVDLFPPGAYPAGIKKLLEAIHATSHHP